MSKDCIHKYKFAKQEKEYVKEDYMTYTQHRVVTAVCERCGDVKITRK